MATLREIGRNPKGKRVSDLPYDERGRFEAMQPKGYYLMSVILSPDNLNTAYKQVESNQGAGGIDKMDSKIAFIFS